MGCGSSRPGQVLQQKHGQSMVIQNTGQPVAGYPPPARVMGPPQHRAPYPQHQRPPYPQQQRPPYPQQYPQQGYRQPVPTQRTYAQQQPNTVVVQDRGRSGAGDMVLGMAVGATFANAMHGHHGYGGFGHGYGGYHDHDTNININEHNEYNYEQNNYGGDTNVENYGDGGYADGGGYDGGGFDDGGGGFDDGGGGGFDDGGFDGGDFGD